MQCVSPQPKTIVLLALSVGLMAQSIFLLSSPLNYDEINMGNILYGSSFPQLVEHFSEAMVGQTSTQHFLSSLSSWATSQVLGMSPVALRLPSLFFLLLFLFFLFQLVRPLSLSGAVAVYLPLLANGLVSFYMHSSRGYISMMAFGLLPLLVTQNTILQNAPQGSRGMWIFGVGSSLVILSNSNGAVSFLLFLGTLLLFFFLWKWNLSDGCRKYLRELCLIGIFLTPIAMAMIFSELSAVRKSTYNSMQPVAGAWMVAPFVFGLNRKWQALALIFGAALTALMRRLHRKQKDFISLYLSVATVFFGTSVLFLKPTYLAPRFFLPYLVPGLLWFAQSIGQLAGPSKKIALVAAFCLLCLIPTFNRKEVRASEVNLMTPFTEFMHVTARTLHSSSCIEVGPMDNVEAVWASRVYYSNQDPSCSEKFYAAFSDVLPPTAKNAVLVYAQAGTQRKLYRLQSNSKFP